MFSYHLIQHPKSLKIDTNDIDDIFRTLDETIESHQRGIINIACVTEKEIQKWNKEYREKDAPTDILTFPYYDDFSECPTGETAGEIIICLEQVQRKNLEAQTNLVGDEVDMESAYYDILIHGLTHMMGYDHEDEDGSEEMEIAETSIKKSTQKENG